MKKLILGVLLLPLLFASAREDSNSEMYGYAQLCNSWRYVSSVSGYICSYTSSKELVEKFDLMQLEQKVERLEQRVRELEAER